MFQQEIWEGGEGSSGRYRLRLFWTRFLILGPAVGTIGCVSLSFAFIGGHDAFLGFGDRSVGEPGRKIKGH